MATNVYIDGFNLHYGSLKDRWPEYKWLNLESFCESLLPDHDIQRIRYFTALVNDWPPGESRRQRTYLRALATLPKVAIHYGRFASHTVRMPLANPEPGGPATVEVLRAEEKGTDVNISRLQQAASWSYRTIYKRYFRGYQLPQCITDANGTFEKPAGM